MCGCCIRRRPLAAVASQVTSVVSPVQHGGVGPVVHLAGQKKRMPPQAAAHGRLQGLLGNIREGVRGTDAGVT